MAMTINREMNRSKATPTTLACSYQAAVAETRSKARRTAGAFARRKLGSNLV